MMKTQEAMESRTTSDPFPTSGAPELAHALRRSKEWVDTERGAATLLGEEILWNEAFNVYRATIEGLPADQRPAAWACIASDLVFDTGRVPLNQRTAAREACDVLVENPDLSTADKARRLQAIADRYNVDPVKVRGLIEPGAGYPWMLPRSLWSRDSVVRGLEVILAPFDWAPNGAPGPEWLAEHATGGSASGLLAALEACAPDGSLLGRMLAAMRSLVDATARDGKDVCVIEAHTFVAALGFHGLSENEIWQSHRQLLALREGVVLLESYHQYHRAERLVAAAEDLAAADPEAAIGHFSRAAGIYQRLAVAQLYPERLLERYHQVTRAMEELRAGAAVTDERSDHMLLVSTYQSPADLQRLLLSVSHELMSFSYGRNVHVVVCDDTTGEAREKNEVIYREATRRGLNIAAWNPERRAAFLDELNHEVFPDGTFDVRELTGPRTPGEKGVPYGRLRNFLRLAGLVEQCENGLDRPVFTWLDQDNELGALVLTRAGTLSKRHVFNYFDQKSEIFADSKVLVGGGGYTNDALEGVEKFWVAWGIMHGALALAQEHAPQGPAILSPEADITRFRPWDQPDTLERIPREGEEVQTMSDQFLLLLNTLVGTFRGKYDNQVQIYHPWSAGMVDPEGECLVEEMRAFAGMPGGNTSFTEDVLGSSIPFITVGGRGEDIFHLWQLEGRHGPGTLFLTHTPALHTRNVKGGRGDLMAEIIDSFNGRIFREPPYLWAALAALSEGRTGDQALPGAGVESETAERIQGLRNEAKASMAAVSGFASALEPYLDGSSEFWWLADAETDPRCAELVDTLRGVVAEYKDVDKYHRLADEKLLGPEDVKDLTSEFITAYPHWQTVVEHVGGRPGDKEPAVALTGPRQDYGASLRGAATAYSRTAGTRWNEPPSFGEPVDEPPWQEVLTSSLLLFRRYESGAAENERLLGWPERVERLRTIYEHYAGYVADLPAFVWTQLFRDALFVPRSAPHQALTELLSQGVPGAAHGEALARVGEVAERFGVDPELLAGALHPSAGLVAS